MKIRITVGFSGYPKGQELDVSEKEGNILVLLKKAEKIVFQKMYEDVFPSEIGKPESVSVKPESETVFKSERSRRRRNKK